MRIGELAAQSGVTTKTIRFWESTGLLADPARTPSGYRDYDPDVVDRLSFIRHAQSAGLTLAEIRPILAISDTGEPSCGHVTDLIHQHLLDVDGSEGLLGVEALGVVTSGHEELAGSLVADTVAGEAPLQPRRPTGTSMLGPVVGPARLLGRDDRVLGGPCAARTWSCPAVCRCSGAE